jgi:hypothetical protein
VGSVVDDVMTAVFESEAVTLLAIATSTTSSVTEPTASGPLCTQVTSWPEAEQVQPKDVVST